MQSSLFDSIGLHFSTEVIYVFRRLYFIFFDESFEFLINLQSFVNNDNDNDWRAFQIKFEKSAIAELKREVTAKPIGVFIRHDVLSVLRLNSKKKFRS